MSGSRDDIRARCEEALRRIDDALAAPEGSSSLTKPMLRNVRSEVAEMKEALDPNVFLPGYGRPLLDWPADDFIHFLIDLEYRYKRLARRHSAQ